MANALLLRPLRFSDPDRLAVIKGVPRAHPEQEGTLSYPFFTFLRDRQPRSFAAVSACTFENFTLTGRGEAQQILSARVAANFFDLLGIQPEAGRTFLPEEDQPGGRQVVLIGDEFWTRRFGRNPNAIGQPLALNSGVYTIIGILPPGFSFPMVGLHVDLWAAKVFDLSYVTPARVAAGGVYYHLIGRLAPGVSRQQAQAENGGHLPPIPPGPRQRLRRHPRYRDARRQPARPVRG